MKTVQYDLRIVHRKKVAIGAINRKEIDRILRDMITSGEALNMEGGEIVGIMVEEKGERDCPGNCDHCSYLCPESGECMMDDLEDRCRSCEYGCEKCGLCSLIDYGVCGDDFFIRRFVASQDVIVVTIGKRDRQLFQRLIQKFLLAFGAIGPKRCIFWGTPRQYAQ